MLPTIEQTAWYTHPPERVWRALTDAEALARWLMPHDFARKDGHAFPIRTKPGPGFDGVVRCEVLERAKGPRDRKAPQERALADEGHEQRGP